MADQFADCVLPTYSETSARQKLARHLARGEEQYIWHCPWSDHWHCTDRSLVELVDSYWERTDG